MNVLAHPGWIALVLCVVGALLAILAMLKALGAANRMRNRLETFAESPLVDDLQGLDYQVQRFATFAPRVEECKTRALAAIETMRSATRATGLPQALASVRVAAASARALASLFR